MGIYKLSKYINEHCKEAYFNSSLQLLQNKIIVIDFMQFIYKFKQEGNLVEKLYLMCSLFRNYNIIAIFVFDGKPDTIKKTCLINRSNQRKVLRDKLKDPNLNENSIKELEKQLIQINKNDIEISKSIILFMGFQIIQARYESDPILSYLSKRSNILGCMSEDSDMFVFGCKFVIKSLNLKNKTIIVYNLNKILKQLNLKFYEFKLLCMLTKNDYNQESPYDFYTMYRLYKNYCRKKIIYIPFNNWINNKPLYNLKYLNNCFKDKKVFEKFNIKLNKVDYKSLKNILSNYGFYFII